MSLRQRLRAVPETCEEPSLVGLPKKFPKTKTALPKALRHQGCTNRCSRKFVRLELPRDACKKSIDESKRRACKSTAARDCGGADAGKATAEDAASRCHQARVDKDRRLCP